MASSSSERNITISTIPKPSSEIHVTLYSDIRLTALRTNPETFGSSYARESAFSRTTWRERVDQQGVITIYASRLCGSESTSLAQDRTFGSTSSTIEAGQCNEGSFTHSLPPDVENPWVAILTLLSPSFITSSFYSTAGGGTSSSADLPWPQSLSLTEDIWILVGMWVRPEYRRRGVARKLVLQALDEVVTQSAKDAQNDVKNQKEVPGNDPTLDEINRTKQLEDKGKDVRILIRVHAGNTAAANLYKSIGFEKLEPPGSSDSKESIEQPAERGVWMDIHIPYLIPND